MNGVKSTEEKQTKRGVCASSSRRRHVCCPEKALSIYLIAQYSCKWPTLGRPTGGHSFSRRTLPRNFVPILHHIFLITTINLVICISNSKPNEKANLSSHTTTSTSTTHSKLPTTMSTEQSKEPTQCTRGCGFYGTGHTLIPS